MQYVTRNIPGPGFDRGKFEEFYEGCDCTGSCCASETCSCLQRFPSAYDAVSQCLKAEMVDSVKSLHLDSHREVHQQPIVECNSHCKCNMDCSNRLVQKGPRFQLMVCRTFCEKNTTEEKVKSQDEFLTNQSSKVVTEKGFSSENHEISHPLVTESDSMVKTKAMNKEISTDTNSYSKMIYTDSHDPTFISKSTLKNANFKGLGLYAEEDIPRYSFVCEYAGEVIGLDEAKRRLDQTNVTKDMNYLIVLREHCSQGLLLTCVDPKFFGNVGRFANHSCDPNMVMIPVRVDDAIPKLCLFARINIKTGEELI